MVLKIWLLLSITFAFGYITRVMQVKMNKALDEHQRSRVPKKWQPKAYLPAKKNGQ
jgi:hypothetical protein